MRLLSWNVNGLRAADKKGFLNWLARESPDILCLQETKCHPGQLGGHLINPPGYKTFWSCAAKKGYSGVAIFTKKEPLDVKDGLGHPEFDLEGRTLMADYGEFVLFNIYFPNGGALNKRVPFKMEFYNKFLEKTNTLLQNGRRIIICGDVNTAHQEIDLARPHANRFNTGFLQEERDWITKLIEHRYIDTFRHFKKEGGHYSWWDLKSGARARNVGWRIDYFFISDNLLPQLKDAYIMKDTTGSDHCPVGIEITL